MRTREDLRTGLAAMLHDLRTRRGLSKAKMARLVDVDDHTWNSWETGRTSPSVVDFLYIFEACGESVMRPTLELLYPDQYAGSASEARDTLTHFISELAPDHAVQVLSFLAFGDHGSNFAPQTELFCAYAHLPMEQRFVIAETVYIAYKLAQNRSELRSPGSVLPDLNTLESGLKKGQKAAYARLQSYTTLTEE